MNNYSQYIAHNLLRYGVHQTVTLKRKMILILMIQRVLIQICWKAWVPQYVIYGRKYKYKSTLILQWQNRCYVLFHTFAKMQKTIHIEIIRNRSTMYSIHYFMEYLKTKCLLLKPYFGLITLTLITRLVHLMVMNLCEKTITSEMVTVICGIKNIHFLSPRLLVFCM